MLKPIKVSVVIPVYKVEQYLNRCLDSIIGQTYKNLEIILVDDGSPDSCPQLCDQWCSRDSRIIVVHKNNEGLGMARNTGIDIATGNYICFVDSDDYIAQDMIEKCVCKIREYDADIVTYGYNRVSIAGKIISSCIPNTEKEFYEKKEVMSYVFPNFIGENTITGQKTHLWMSLCGSLFSLEMIKKAGWRSVSERDIIAEDVYSLMSLFEYVNKIVIVPRAFYYYCVNKDSLTHTYRTDRYDRIKHFYDSCYELCMNKNYDQLIINRLYSPYISFVIAALKILVNADLNISNKRLLFKKIIEDEHLQRIIGGVNHKKESITRRILLFVIRNKMYTICYLLIKIKS